MLRFFRTLRQRLLAENRVSRYLLYAVGEILLVVIGILIALQIDNWSEARKQQEQFRLGLEQAYNAIDLSLQSVGLTTGTMEITVRYIEELLEQPENIPDWKLPYILYFVDQGLDDMNANIFSITAPALLADPNDIAQLKLAREVSSYFDRKLWQSNSVDSLVTPILYQAGIPYPMIDYGVSEHQDFEDLDSAYYSQDEKRITRALVTTQEVRQALRSLRASLLSNSNRALANTMEEGYSVKESIESFFPDVRLLYKDVGIIGTAINGYLGVPSTPMELVDESNSIWETDLDLKDGTVKFRTGDSWNQNWGGNTFPSGMAMYYWSNIPVQAGRYRIRLNLTDKTYEFIPLPE